MNNENLYAEFNEFYDATHDLYSSEEEAMDDFLELIESEDFYNDEEDFDYEDEFEFEDEEDFDYEDEDEDFDFEDEDYEGEDEFEFEDEDEYSNLELTFEDFYAETADIYGDDLDEAYNDFIEIADEMYAETTKAEEPKKTFKQKAKGLADNIHGSKWKSAAVYGTVGAGAGAGLTALATSFGKDAAERKILKAKAKAGEASSEELARLKVLLNSRRNKVLAGTAVGAGVGAAGGAYGKAGYNKVRGLFTKKEQEAAKKEDAKEQIEDLKADMFADYYVENIDIYGDDRIGLEIAYEDFFAEAPATPGFMSRMKNKGKGLAFDVVMDKKKSALAGGIAGAGLGLAGGMIKNRMSSTHGEYKALQAKAKAGQISAAEMQRLNQLKSGRRNSMLIGTTAGAGLGAAAGYGAQKKWGEAAGQKILDSTNSSLEANTDRMYSDVNEKFVVLDIIKNN